MGPAVVLGQDLAKTAGPVRHRSVADLATGDWQLGDGHGETAGRWLAHLLLWCQPSRSCHALSLRHTHSTRHVSAFARIRRRPAILKTPRPMATFRFAGLG